MTLALAMALAQSATAAATVVLPDPLPQRAEAAIWAYQDCLSEEIGAQDRRRAYSERAVLSACAGVRRAKYGEAIAGLNQAGWSAAVSRRRIHQRFAELDETVWTIVGHIRARHSGR